MFVLPLRNAVKDGVLSHLPEYSEIVVQKMLIFTFTIFTTICIYIYKVYLLLGWFVVNPECA